MPRDYLYSIAGERFCNPDGSSRQAELKRCRPGEPVILKPEPDNPHDPCAVAVLSARGIQVGYMKREHAERICDDLYQGDISAIVERVEGGGSRPLELVIRVNFDGKAPKLPERSQPAPVQSGVGCAVLLLLPIAGIVAAMLR